MKKPYGIQNMMDPNTRCKNWQRSRCDEYMQSYNDKLDRLISEIESFLK